MTILGSLEDSFAGVASFSSKQSFETESAFFGEAFVRAGHQLGTALLASKEILLVVADFNDVQVRNLRVAQDRLLRAKDRLQKGLVILAHRDPNGDTKLRNWGRDQGLTVLPINYASSYPQGADLLNALLSDLYSYDRFDLTGPVRSEFQFFGRQYFPDLARRLSDGTIHALFGMRKIGKTSLINRVQEELTKKLDCRCVMLDASDDSVASLSATALLHSIRKTATLVNSSGFGPYMTVVADTPTQSTTISEQAQGFLEAIQSSDQPLVLIIDEIDYITPSSPTFQHWTQEFNPFFRALRRVYQESTRSHPPFSLLLSGVSSRWFTEESIDGVENAALALVPEGYLAPLDRSESVEMVETIGAACGLIFDRKSATSIAATASDNPFWIRKAGSYINSCYSASERPIRPDSNDIAQLCAEFCEVEGNQLAYSSLRHLFRIYPDLGFAALSAVEGRPDEVSQELLSFLGRYGILGEQVEPSGPMISEGLRRWKSSDSAALGRLTLPVAQPEPSKIEAGSSSPAQEQEWASMLSEVALHRNSVERDLRDLILVIVRSECSTSGRQAADVLRAALPAERRAAVDSLPAAPLLKTLYWIDLLQIIRKNWRWFERIFGERSKFDMWGEIVNDRPDAHAKDLDGAELALQRRAIEWYRAAIARSGLL